LNTRIDRIYELTRKASEVIYKVLHRTPLDYSTSFSRMTGCHVYLKLENMQKTGSFKSRGAYFKIHSHLDEARRMGVVAASSGNHAQGVAFASSMLGVKSTIVMPETTPIYKINATRSYGADVVLYGSVYDDAYRKALEIAEASKAMLVHPFNDEEVIAGQGTIGLEIASQLPDVDAVIAPIGGGGLISGIGVALKKLKPSVKVIGVEPAAAPKYYESRKTGKITSISPSPSLADGVLAKSVGDITYEVMNQVVDNVVVVNEDSIARAIYLLMERAKMIVEGAGALPLAAMLEGLIANTRKKVALVISGGNIDLTTLYRVVIRGLANAGRVAMVKLTVPDAPGQLYRALGILYRNKCNVIEIKHDRFQPDLPVGYAIVDVVFEAPSKGDVDKVIEELRQAGFRVN
jgi:threonine dehydratase